MADNYLETVEIPDGTNLTVKDPNAAVGANSSTANNLPKFSGTDGKTLADSGVSVETTLTANSDAKIPTSKAVATHVTSAIGELDVTGSAYGAGKTILAWSETDGKVSITSQDISITKSQVSDFAHTHGSITNDGKITDTGVALASGDSLAFVDSSDSSKIKKTSVTFDGSTTTQALTKKGSFESFLQSHQTIKQDGVTGATVNRFGTCSIAAATAAKTVSITTGTFTLEAGARVTVKFSNANTASSPTLNVNSTGAKNIFHKGSQITTGTNKALLAGTVDFIYDGTQWHLIGNYLDTDTKVNVTLGTTTKAYLLGTSTAPTSSAQAVTSIADTDVYLDSTAGKLHAKTLDATTYSGLPTATTSASGIVSLTDSVSTTSSTVAATATAVKTVNTLATTNQTNIWYAINNGVKNELVITDLYITSASQGVTYKLNDDQSITINAPSTHSKVWIYINYDSRTDMLNKFKNRAMVISGMPTNSQVQLNVWHYDGTNIATGDGTDNGKFTLSVTDPTAYVIQIFVPENVAASNVVIKPMICTEDVWNQSHDYMPPALPNSDLTHLEAEDRASLAEVVDSGAKNLVDIAAVTTTGSEFVLDHVGISLSAGSYVFSYTSTQSRSGNIQMIIRNGTTVLADHTVTSQSGRIAIPFTINSAANNITLYSVRAGTYSDFMVCTKAAFDVSQKFVPYRPNWDLVQSAITPGSFVISKYDNTYTVVSTGWKLNGFAWFTFKISSTANINADTTTTVANVPLTQLPKIDSNTNVPLSAGVGSNTIRAWLQSDGYILIRSNISITAGTNIYISGCYPY